MTYIPGNLYHVSGFGQDDQHVMHWDGMFHVPVSPYEDDEWLGHIRESFRDAIAVQTGRKFDLHEVNITSISRL